MEKNSDDTPIIESPDSDKTKLRVTLAYADQKLSKSELLKLKVVS